MKIVLMSLLLLCFSCSEEESIQVENESFEIKKDIKVNLRNKARGITGSYWISEAGCKIKWAYSISSSKNEKNINLELVDSGLSKGCQNDFSLLLNMHSAILKKFNSEYDNKKVNKVKIRGLRSIDPLKRCNKVIAQSSSSSSLYQDYRDKYPKHDSKLSINEIFKKIMETDNVCGEFFAVLKTNGIPVSIYSVERVFTNKKEKLTKYFESLKSLSSRVIWDAGYFYLKD